MSIILLSIGVFLLVMLVDIVWVYYIKHITNNNPHSAAFFAFLIYFIGGASIISYTSNTWLLIPAALGSYLGTYLAVKIKLK